MAGAAYKAVSAQDVRKVVVLAPSHYTRLRYVAVSMFDSLETPLGELRVCRKDCQKLLESSASFKPMEKADDAAEHALEMQLFQIKHIFPNCHVVPLVVGHMSATDRKHIAQVIRSTVEYDLLVISSDFSHYGANYDYDPFGDEEDVDSRLREMDQEAFAAISSGSSGSFNSYLQRTKNTVCGKEPIMLALDMLDKDSRKWKMLAYDRSSKSDSFEESSVGYLAAAFVEL